MSKKDIQAEILKEQGYLTVEEFVSKLSKGLQEYLKTSWPEKDLLHHPEDLFASASIYVEVGRIVIGDFASN